MSHPFFPIALVYRGSKHHPRGFGKAEYCSVAPIIRPVAGNAQSEQFPKEVHGG